MSISSNQLKVLIVDDHFAWCSTLRFGLMITFPNIKIVGEASNGQSAIELCELTKPDLVLLDINMPGMDGFETAKALLAKQPDLQIIGVSAEVDLKRIQIAKEVGFSSLLPKDMLMDRLPLTNFHPNNVVSSDNTTLNHGSA